MNTIPSGNIPKLEIIPLQNGFKKRRMPTFGGNRHLATKPLKLKFNSILAINVGVALEIADFVLKVLLCLYINFLLYLVVR